MEQAEQVDTKPSGPAFQPPFDLSFEFNLVCAKLIAATYASLHPVNVLVATCALAIVATGQHLSLGDRLEVELLRSGPPADFLRVGLPVEVGTVFQFSPSHVAATYLHPWLEMVTARGGDFWRLAFACLFQLGVWSWAATLICRSTALRMLRVDHQWLDVFRFVNRHYFDAVFSVLIPITTVLLLGLPLAVMGSFLVGDGLSVVGSLGAVVLAVLALPIGLVLLGLLLSWPLMFPAIAFEGRDSFESISRAYAYVLQRPIHTFLVAGLAVAIGSIVGYVVVLFFSIANGGFLWSLGWGANLLDTARLDSLLSANPSDSAVVDYASGPMLRFANGLFHWLAVAAQVTVFWGLASGGYLLLRRYLDQTPVDEIVHPGGPPLEPLLLPSRLSPTVQGDS